MSLPKTVRVTPETWAEVLQKAIPGWDQAVPPIPMSEAALSYILPIAIDPIESAKVGEPIFPLDRIGRAVQEACEVGLVESFSGAISWLSRNYAQSGGERSS